MAATTVRTAGAGNARRAHSAGSAGAPGGRLANTATLTSRQPPVVLTLPASMGTSITPGAAAKRPAAPRSSRAPVARAAAAWVAWRMVSSSNSQPLSSASNCSALANDCRAPASTAIRSAAALR